MSLTPEVLTDVRRRASGVIANGDDGAPWASPSCVLALLDRVEELEKDKADALSALGHAYNQRAAEIEAGGWTRRHPDKCGCATCRAEFPRRFTAPGDP